MKIVAIIFWVVFIAACLSLVPEPLGLWVNILGVLLLLMHLIEFLVFKNKIIAKGDEPPKAFLMTMLFGVFYFHF